MDRKDNRIKDLEEENEQLKKKLRKANSKFSHCFRLFINRERDASFEFVNFDRDR